MHLLSPEITKYDFRFPRVSGVKRHVWVMMEPYIGHTIKADYLPYLNLLNLCLSRTSDYVAISHIFHYPQQLQLHGHQYMHNPAAWNRLVKSKFMYLVFPQTSLLISASHNFKKRKRNEKKSHT